MSDLPRSLILIGAGKMGGALLDGWLRLGVPASGMTVIDPMPGASLQDAARRHGFRLNPAASEIGASDVLILAIKPQSLDAAAPAIAPFVGPGTLIVSIMAGKTIGDLAARLPAANAIVRAMPNTPAAVGRGITGVVAAPGVSAGQRRQAEALLGCVGGVVWVDTESQIDAVTAVSGSGPAYVFYLVECLAEAGVAAGLPADVALRLARATVEGAGELMFREPETDAGQLRRNVTSPGGTTAAALDVLMGADGLAALMRQAVAAAKRRAGELSG